MAPLVYQLSVVPVLVMGYYFYFWFAHLALSLSVRSRRVKTCLTGCWGVECQLSWDWMNVWTLSVCHQFKTYLTCLELMMTRAMLASLIIDCILILFILRHIISITRHCNVQRHLTGHPIVINSNSFHCPYHTLHYDCYNLIHIKVLL